MRFVPYIGVFVAAAFPLALAAMVDPGWWMLLETAAVFLIGEPLVGQIVEPLLFGSQTRYRRWRCCSEPRSGPCCGGRSAWCWRYR